jgi:hypothetical protein
MENIFVRFSNTECACAALLSHTPSYAGGNSSVSFQAFWVDSRHVTPTREPVLVGLACQVTQQVHERLFRGLQYVWSWNGGKMMSGNSIGESAA